MSLSFPSRFGLPCWLVLLLALLQSSAFAGANTVTIIPAVTALDSRGGTLSFSITLEHGSDINAVAVNALAPSSVWTYQSASGSNVPELLPNVGATGDKGDGFSCIYLTIPPTPGSFSLILKYPSGLKEKQAIQFQGFFVNGAGVKDTVTQTITLDPPPVAPTIVTSPESVTASVGSAAQFGTVVTGTAPLAYQWRKNKVAIAGAVANTYEITQLQLTDAANYDLVVTNAVGSATSATAKLTVNALPVIPTLTTSPKSVSASEGASVKLTVVASGTAPFTYQWYKDSSAISGAAAASYSIAKAVLSDSGTYFVKVSNTAGSTQSNSATIDIAAKAITPSIVDQPASIAAKVGESVAFSVNAQSNVSATYQWYKNNVAITGATSATLSLPSITSSSAGSYTVKITNTAGSVTSSAAKLTIGTLGRISALSIRTNAGTGDQTLIVGLVVAGSSKKSVLVRGIGPSLIKMDSSLQNLLPDPVETLYSASGAALAKNDNWGGTTALKSAFTATSVSTLDASSKDAALLNDLSGGAYTIHLTDASSKSGLVLVELYDASSSQTDDTRLQAVSARATAGSGQNVLIAGLVITGDSSIKTLIRGMGPALAKDGVKDFISDPKIAVYDLSGKSIASNDNWGGDVNIKAAITSIGATLPADDSKDAALFVTLSPGVYTVQISGSNDSQGVVLADIWEIP